MKTNKTFKLALTLLTAAAFALCVQTYYSHSTRLLLNSYDTGWLIRTGEYIVQYGAPSHDIFSWTNSDRAFVAYQWLFEVMAFEVYKFGGLRLLCIAACIMTGCLYFYLLPSLWMRKGIPPVVPYATLSLVLFSHWFSVRPQLFSYYFFLAVILILESYRVKSSRLIWLLLPVMVVWINVHSFWVLGLLFIAVYWIAKIYRTRSALNSLSIVIPLILLSAVFLNPYGIGLGTYLISFVDGSQYMGMHEVKSIVHHFGVPEVRFVCAYLMFFWIFAIRRWRLLSPESFVICAFITVASLVVVRYLSVAVIITWPYLGHIIANSVNWKRFNQHEIDFKKLSIPITARHTALLCTSLAISVAIALVRLPNETTAENLFFENSSEVIKVLKDRLKPKERIFNDCETGSWLILAETGPVAIDTRFDMYPKKFVQQVYDVLYVNTTGGAKYLDERGIDYVIVQNAPTVRLSDSLRQTTDWKPLVSSEHLILWSRTKNIGELSDEALRSSQLPESVIKATMLSRCLQYFQRAKTYSSEKRYKLATHDLQKAVALIPDSDVLNAALIRAKNCRNN